MNQEMSISATGLNGIDYDSLVHLSRIWAAQIGVDADRVLNLMMCLIFQTED